MARYGIINLEKLKTILNDRGNKFNVGEVYEDCILSPEETEAKVKEIFTNGYDRALWEEGLYKEYKPSFEELKEGDL